MTHLEDISSPEKKTGIEITEALRLQLEVQQRLQKQVEMERNLQLRIEEQGKYLKLMFEKQCKPGIDIDKLKSCSSAILENPSVLSAKVSPTINHDMDVNQAESDNRADGCPNTNSALGESSQDQIGKLMTTQSETPENSESNMHM